MKRFQLAFLGSLLVTFAWGVGIFAGVTVMGSQGSEQQSMELDPTKNGTITIYVCLIFFQVLAAGSAFFGFFLCFKIWRNQFQLDKSLRSGFVMWFSAWIFSYLGITGISIYALVRGKDPQGQLGFMYEMFQKNAQHQVFVASFERFQRQHSCCGIYGPDDWLMVQLQQQPGAAAFQALDFGMQMNPSTGKCHLVPPTIPVGCGRVLMYQINQVVKMYAGLLMVQAFLGVATSVLAWYCFFNWLEEDVMILPTDELCEIIVVEPPDEDEAAQNELDELNDEEYEDLPNESFYEPSWHHSSSRYPRSHISHATHSYLHHSGSGSGSHRHQRSYIVLGGDKYGHSRRTVVHGSTIASRRRSRTSTLGGTRTSRTRTKIYLTKSQLETEPFALSQKRSNSNTRGSKSRRTIHYSRSPTKRTITTARAGSSRYNNKSRNKRSSPSYNNDDYEYDDYDDRSNGGSNSNSERPRSKNTRNSRYDSRRSHERQSVRPPSIQEEDEEEEEDNDEWTFDNARIPQNHDNRGKSLGRSNRIDSQRAHHNNNDSSRRSRRTPVPVVDEPNSDNSSDNDGSPMIIDTPEPITRRSTPPPQPPINNNHHHHHAPHHSQPSTSSRSRSNNKKPVEAKILYKNRNALNRTDSS